MDDLAPLHSAIPELPPPRSFWRRMADRVVAYAWTLRPADPPEKSVAFTIAVIVLGAKMAKVDGTVARSEVAALRRIFVIPRAEERNAARVFNRARQDVAGFDAWARRLARLFPPGDPVLADVIEGLFVIAAADGAINVAEMDFLAEVGRIFGLTPAAIAAIRARHDRSHGCQPCDILGVTPATPLPEARAKWRAMVRESHPDRAIARGLPAEAIRLAEARTRRLNEAWDAFRAMHRPLTPA